MDKTLKRCLYEVLGLPRTCTPEEIRSAYRKLALQLHPDKIRQSSASAESIDSATAAFQELQHAYDVLSDPRERSWYDSHRIQILSPQSSSSSSLETPNLWPYFSNSAFSGFGDTGRGFYKVFGDVFAKVYSCEVSFANAVDPSGTKFSVREAPAMGNLKSDYFQVSAFYDYWLGFSTVLDFSWLDQYRPSAAPNRKLRRMAEDENNKFRRKAKREYNEMVRGLAEFVKKRDKRVIERKLQKDLEQKKKEEAELLRKKEAQKAKREKAMAYQEPEWAKAAEEEEEIDDAFDEQRKEVKEFYCIVCSKKFKSDKQWKNHEQSKKHRMKLAELGDPSDVEPDGGIDGDLLEEFEDSVKIREDDSNGEDDSFGNADGLDDDKNDKVGSTIPDLDGDREEYGIDSASDDEMSILEAMVKEQRTRRNGISYEMDGSHTEDYSRTSFGESESNVGTSQASGEDSGNNARHDKSKEDFKNKDAGADDSEVQNNGFDKKIASPPDDGDLGACIPILLQDETSESVKDTGASVNERKKSQGKNKSSAKYSGDKRSVGQNDSNVKQKTSSKGRKQKATLKLSGNACETCGEDFGSRNKLFAHLSSTGHAALQSR